MKKKPSSKPVPVTKALPVPGENPGAPGIFARLRMLAKSPWRWYINLPWPRRLILLMLTALILRLATAVPLSVELDTHFFVRTTGDMTEALRDGSIFHRAPIHENYYGIEYRPPLYALTGAVLNLAVGNVELSLYMVSLLAGVLLMVPVFLLGRELFGDPAGDIATALCVMNPSLVFISGMGLSESLYLLFFMGGVYFTLTAWNRGKLQDYILCGVSFGLAYLVRFDGLAGAGIAGIILASRIIPRKDEEPSTGEIVPVRGLLWGGWLIAFLLVISPYLIITRLSSGTFSLTSPAKQLYDLSEGLYIVRGERDGYRGFIYRLGAPGEMSYRDLKQVTGTTGGRLYRQNRRLIIQNTVKSLPENIWVARSNLSWFMILTAGLFFWMNAGKTTLRDILPGWFIMAVLPGFLFQFWDPSPRYFVFLVPLFSLWSGKFIWDISRPRQNVQQGSPVFCRVLLWVLIPGAILASWTVSTPRPLVYDFWQLTPEFVAITAESRGILLPVFIAITALGLAHTLYYRSASPGVLFASAGSGLLSLPGILNPPSRTITPGHFLTGYDTAPTAGILMLILLGAIYYHTASRIQEKNRDAFLRGAIITGLILMVPVNVHNILVARRARIRYNHLSYNTEAALTAKGLGSPGEPVFCLHPRDAWIAGGRWMKIPPWASVEKIRKVIKEAGGGWFIAGSGEMDLERSRSLLPALAILKQEGTLELSGVFTRPSPARGIKPVTQYLFRIVPRGTPKDNDPVTLESPPEKPLEINTSAPWPYYRGDIHNTGRTNLPGPGRDARIQWKFKAGHEIFSSPVIDHQGRVYFGCDDSRIYCVDQDGQQVWTYATGYYVSAPGTLDEEERYLIGSNDQYLYCLDRNGQPVWKFKTEYYISSAPLIADGRIYFGGEDHHLYCLNADGELLWKFKAGDEIIGTPALSRDKSQVYFTCRDGGLYCLDTSGRLAWKFPTGGPVTGSPAVGKNDIIYIGSTDGNIYGINPDGSLLWKHPTGAPVEGSPAIGINGNVYGGSKDSYLYCLSSQGELQWRFSTGYGVESSPVIDRQGRVYFGSHDRNLYCLSPAGEQIFRIPVQGAMLGAPAIGAGGRLYVVSLDNHLYCITNSGE